ncbi:MAG: phenylalanine--tRNA ligase subunit alpha [Alphaproteobacteria bacterium]|nr:MAG: phenylalanine--tRNA ligase subunit alpha [Alphaproteobacteria bacterium]
MTAGRDLALWRRESLEAVESAPDLAALDAVRIALLGRKGSLTEALKGLAALSPDEKRAQGVALNALRDEFEQALRRRQHDLAEAELERRLSAEKVDVTLSVAPRDAPEAQGMRHPLTQAMAEIAEIFAGMGFRLAEGPDIEDDDYNFTRLNMPPDHPARQMQDSFYLPLGADGVQRLPRTHTSAVQVRAMLAQGAPMRTLIMGRVFRCDYDITHTPMFHQVEGLVIEDGIHMGHLKGCLTEFLRAYFGLDQVRLRFRPSFFPFTEPSAEIDIACSRREGVLRLGEGEDWLEILGCGMVHSRVLQAGGLDPLRWRGFAFGAGVERLAMLKYGIPDLRTFFDSDLRWLRHYGLPASGAPSAAMGFVGR